MKNERQPNPIAQEFGQGFLQIGISRFGTRTAFAQALGVDRKMINLIGNGAIIPNAPIICDFLAITSPNAEEREILLSPLGELLRQDMVPLTNARKVVSESTRRKMSESHKGKSPDPSAITRMAETKRGYRHTLRSRIQMKKSQNIRRELERAARENSKRNNTETDMLPETEYNIAS